MTYEVGAHLPLMDFGGNPYTLQHREDYARAADRLGFAMLSANDHLAFAVPWLDGPTALAAVLRSSGTMGLATTVALPVAGARCNWRRPSAPSTACPVAGSSSPSGRARRHETMSWRAWTSTSAG